MVAKNIKGKSFGGCVRYVLSRESSTLLEAKDVLSLDTESIIRSFALQRSLREEITRPVGHIPISFSPQDKARMTDAFMVELGKEYMERMGIEDTQYIMVRHNNTDHPHLHIVYNRIDNNGELISVNNDYKRNVTVCRQMKEKYHLTFGEGKEHVNRQRLRGADKERYAIYDAIAEVLPTVKCVAELTDVLNSRGIDIERTCKMVRTEKGKIVFTDRFIFERNGQHFSCTQIDRKYSASSIIKQIKTNNKIEQSSNHSQPIKRTNQSTNQGGNQTTNQLTNSQTAKRTADLKQSFKPKAIPTVIGGVRLIMQQRNALVGGKAIFLEGIVNRQGKVFSAYVTLNTETRKVSFSNYPPKDIDTVSPKSMQTTTPQPQVHQTTSWSKQGRQLSAANTQTENSNKIQFQSQPDGHFITFSGGNSLLEEFAQNNDEAESSVRQPTESPLWKPKKKRGRKM